VIERIVSGGQTGADRGGLDAARDLGIPFGGWAPAGWRAEDGAIPVEYRASMRATLTRDYPTRTRLNVKESDGTIVVSFGRTLTGGSLDTWNLCEARERPRLHLVLKDPLPALRGLLIDWIGRHRIRVLNVAGPRESKEPGIQDAARRVLASCLRGVVLR
jgi:hypothetical protein